MMPRQRITYTIVTTAALLCLMQIGGCTCVTHFKEYRISKTEDDAPDGIWIHLSFTPSRYNSMCIPGLYDVEQYRDPYKCQFTIWGDFDELKTIVASMTINDGKPIVIPLDVVKLNRNRKLSQNKAPYFPAGEIPLEDKAHDMRTIVVATSFSAVVDGNTKDYSITNKYRMTTHEQTGNRWWFSIMGI